MLLREGLSRGTSFSITGVNICRNSSWEWFPLQSLWIRRTCVVTLSKAREGKGSEVVRSFLRAQELCLSVQTHSLDLNPASERGCLQYLNWCKSITTWNVVEEIRSFLKLASRVGRVHCWLPCRLMWFHNWEGLRNCSGQVLQPGQADCCRKCVDLGWDEGPDGQELELEKPSRLMGQWALPSLPIAESWPVYKSWNNVPHTLPRGLWQLWSTAWDLTHGTQWSHAHVCMSTANYGVRKLFKTMCHVPTSCVWGRCLSWCMEESETHKA